ncbi:hypothetical protein PybrP1_004268 [[Pythium] brassicae (nom. inval.)]|nr:hypothetical protein PybrP1_004268 [[Pythium] brassicae (nom. inval.)]
MVALVRDDERDGFEDLLGSGGIFRKMLRTNADGAQVEFGEEVTIRYSEKVLESNVTVTSEETRTLRIGDGEAMPALELVAKMMRVGEACEVRCDPRFAYGDVGREPKVPPGAAMKLQVELLRVGKKSTAEMTSAELIAEANKKKESGNRYFQEKNYEQAAKLYKRALKLLESWEHAPEEEAACKELLVSLGNNVGNVQFRLRQFAEARQSSLEVLQLDPRNAKAMYRVAQIGLEQSDFTEGIEFAQRAAALEPKNAAVRQLLKDLKKKKQQVKQEQKRLYAKLGGASATGGSTAALGGPDGAAQSRLVRAAKANPSLVAALVTLVIAGLVYQFVGKRYNDMG